MTDDPLRALLRRAKSMAGSIEALARYLHVPKKQLGGWIDGDVETPRSVLLRAVDFVREGRPVTPR